MNRDQKTFERIEDYLNENLTAEERTDFEQQMENDPELKQEVELHRSLNIELSNTDALNFREKIAKIGKELNEREPKNNFFSWKIAASLLVLVGLAAYLLLRPTTGENLFETYYRPYPVEDLVRGENTTDNNIVLDSYVNGNYIEVVPELKRLAKENPTDEALLLYLGNCYLNLDQEEEAINVFQGFSKQSKYYEDAQWYLALSYVKRKNFKNATERLRWLVEYDGLHKKNSTELLKAIRVENPDDF